MTKLEIGKKYLLTNGKIFTPDELNTSHYPIGGIITNPDGSKDRIAYYTFNGIYDMFNIQSKYNVVSELKN